MSLDAAFAKDEYDLRKIMSGGRGRSVVSGGPERSVSPGSRGVSRGRPDSRGRSSSRRRNGSRARSQTEDVNWKWSILRHNPAERFKGRNNTDITKLNVDGDGDESDDSDNSDNSEEEQISDDETEFLFDINDIVLPNFKMSINEFYKKKTRQNTTSLTDIDDKEKELEQLRLKKEQDEVENKKRKEELEELLNKKSEELRHNTEILALGKALSDSKLSGMGNSNEDVEEIKAKLIDLGIKDPENISIDDIIEIETKKDKVYDEYKKLLIDKSKQDAKDEIEETEEEIKNNRISNKDVIESSIQINKEDLRVSKTITLGNFFNRKVKAKDVESYLIYLDLSPDSVNALQYTIGSVVKSGDVLYIVNSVDNDTNIDYFEKQCEKLTELVTTYLKLIECEHDFTLHVVLETTYHKYPKFLVNELIKYLKPNFFIVGHSILMSELSNYMPDIPILVVKKKVRRRRSIHRV